MLAMQEESGELVRQALCAAAGRAADGRAAVLAWIEEFLSIGWDARRLREGRTFLAPEVGLVAGVATAMEDIHARHRAVLEAALRRALTDRTLPAAVPERDAFAIHAVVLRCLEMRARRAARPFLPSGARRDHRAVPGFGAPCLTPSPHTKYYT